MALDFNEIPSNILVPLFHAEVRPAFHPFNSSLRLLLVGHKVSTAPIAYNTPVILSSAEVNRLFGSRSMVSAMYRTARANAPFIEIWGMATDPASGAVAATGNIRVTGTPSLANSGTMDLLVGGVRIRCNVRPTDTQAALAARLATTLQRERFIPVTAVVDGVDNTKVNLTCAWLGQSGNGIQVNARFWGADAKLEARLLTITQPSGGIGFSGMSVGLGALGDQPFDILCIGFGANAIHLDSVQDFFDHVSGRWSTYKQLYGHAVTAQRDSYANLITLGNGRNDPHMTILGAGPSPFPQWYWAAALGAKMTHHYAAPPEISRPLQTLELKGILPPTLMDDWFNIEERQALLEAGIATWTADKDGTVRVNRDVTTYKTNVWGDADASWRDANTLFQASYFVKRMRGAIQGAFPRAALTSEDTNIPGFASPGKIYDVIVHEYRRLQNEGLVEKVDLFAEGLVVERDEIDANRVNVLMRPDVVNQLRVVAAIVETNLELDDTTYLNTRFAA